MSGYGRVVLDMFPSIVRREVHDIGFLEVLRDSGFDAVPLFIVYSPSSEVPLAWVEPAQR